MDKQTPPPLWGHQSEALQRARTLPGYALFFEMGTGKSRTCISIIEEKFRQHERPLKTIIFCPPLVVPNWREEWGRYTNVDLKTVQPLFGSATKRLETFNKHQGKNGIFITNYEALLMEDLFEAFVQWGPEVLVFDESHKCKAVDAKRSKRAYTLANPFDREQKRPNPKPYTYILSGSPILNSPMDIFMQFKILDGGERLGSNFWAFRAKYFRDRNAHMPKGRHFPKWEVMTPEKDGVDALKEINEIIFQQGMRVEKKDCLDLPPEVSITIPVEMSAEQARLYKEMKNDFVTYYNSRACVATLAITKALRLLQITAGFLALEDQDTDLPTANIQTILPDTPKLAALEALLSDLIEQGHKVLVWAVWRVNYEQIRAVCDKLGVGYVEVHGGVSDKAKRDGVERFKNDPTKKVFIGHPGSGGIGINLVNAAYSIFYSRTFSLEHYLQARARNHRGGSREAGHACITHYDLVVQGTIDELVSNALASKQEISDKVLKNFIQESGS